MPKILICTICILISVSVNADSAKLIGTWEASDRAHMAIYGYIKITRNTVYWGHNIKNFPCKAKYEIVLEGEAENYPGNHISKPAGVSMYEYFKLKLVDKTCDFDLIRNSHIHQKIGYIQMSFPTGNHNLIGFNDFDESGQSLGWGQFYKYVK